MRSATCPDFELFAFDLVAIELLLSLRGLTHLGLLSFAYGKVCPGFELPASGTAWFDLMLFVLDTMNFGSSSLLRGVGRPGIAPLVLSYASLGLLLLLHGCS